MEICAEFTDFVKLHLKEDPAALRLKYRGRSMPFDVSFAIDQIECRRKTARKLPTFLADENFLFPSVLSSEQCTGEVLGRFHASVLPSGADAFDMTCGLGIDDMCMYPRLTSLVSCDLTPLTAETARHNFSLYGMDRAEAVCADSLQWLEEHPQRRFGFIFADPARRGDCNKRTFALADCSPDIVAALPLLRRHAPKLYLKASPMLDITAMCRELGCVARLWILSVRNECKELFAECDLTASTPPDTEVTALNFTGTGIPPVSVSFRLSDPLPTEILFIGDTSQLKGSFLYMPDASVMKSGRSAIAAHRYGLKKLHTNSMLYTSETLSVDFPGNIFCIRETLTMQNAKRSLAKGSRRNIICRNFPIKPSQLAASLKIREGSENDFLIATTVGNSPRHILLDCTQFSKNK